MSGASLLLLLRLDGHGETLTQCVQAANRGFSAVRQHQCIDRD